MFDYFVRYSLKNPYKSVEYQMSMISTISMKKKNSRSKDFLSKCSFDLQVIFVNE